MELNLLGGIRKGALIEELESEGGILLLKVLSLLLPLALLTDKSLFIAEDLVHFLEFGDDGLGVSIALKSFSQYNLNCSICLAYFRRTF